MAFAGPAPTGTEGAHLNGNRTDCRAANLAWVTHAENIGHQEIHGTKPLGERNGKTRLTAENVREIRARRRTGESFPSIARRFGISKRSAAQVAKGLTWAHIPESDCPMCTATDACAPHRARAIRQRRRMAAVLSSSVTAQEAAV